jgi:hypothetical protein
MAKKKGKYKTYKGKPPFSVDLILKWFLKMILQVIIFSAIYFFNIEAIRLKYDYNPIMEFLVIITWIFITDFIVAILVLIIKTVVLYYLEYIPNDKKNNNAELWLWEYLIYSVIRAICYLICLISLLTSLFATKMPELLAFILAWITISIVSRAIARFGSIWIKTR